MDITFVLPSPTLSPSGGFKVVYEYADRLSSRGHNINIVHCLNLPHTPSRWPYIVRYIALNLFQLNGTKWFRFHNKVNISYITEISEKNIPDGDAIFATWWDTVFQISELSSNKGAKFCLIQGYEIWHGYCDLVHESYNKMDNIVISNWLAEKVISAGGNIAAKIPNALDFDVFKLSVPIAIRDPKTILMIYHESVMKGFQDGFEAVTIARSKFPELKLAIFSVYKKPDWLPEWVEFIKDPKLSKIVELYNNNAIFLSSSWEEGFCLPGAEALACGCALVSYDNGGIREYANNDINALISEPRDSKVLAANLIKLIQDDEYRIRIAANGNESIQSLSWSNSVNNLETLVLKSANKFKPL